MAVTLKGEFAQGPILQEESKAFDPEFGPTVLRRWIGTKIAIYGMVSELETAGIHYAIDKQRGPFYQLTARYVSGLPSVPDPDPVRWSITTQTLEKDIFQQPDINAEMQAGVVDYRKGIEDAVANGHGLGLSYATSPLAPKVLIELKRGVRAYEDSYLVLRRTRVVGAGVTPKMNIRATSLIYSTAELGVPGEVAFSLPDISALTAPVQTLWGWRLTGHESEFEGARIQQRHEFVLAAWSTLLYTAAGGNFTG